MKKRILNAIQDLRIELGILSEYTIEHNSDVEELNSALNKAYNAFENIEVNFVKDMPVNVFLMLGQCVIDEEYFAKIPDKIEMEMVDIKGVLTIKDKIWFNDIGRCRLRICGFSDDDIKRLENAIFVDISITDTDDECNIKGKLYISEIPQNRLIFNEDCDEHSTYEYE